MMITEVLLEDFETQLRWTLKRWPIEGFEIGDFVLVGGRIFKVFYKVFNYPQEITIRLTNFDKEKILAEYRAKGTKEELWFIIGVVANLSELINPTINTLRDVVNGDLTDLNDQYSIALLKNKITNGMLSKAGLVVESLGIEFFPVENEEFNEWRYTVCFRRQNMESALMILNFAFRGKSAEVRNVSNEKSESFHTFGNDKQQRIADYITYYAAKESGFFEQKTD